LGTARIIAGPTVFENHVWKLHGLPDNFVSDRDVRFQAEFWKCFCEHFGIQHNKSSAKHPQSDGQTERANGVLEDTLRHFVNQDQNNWDDLLPVAEFAMNNAYNESIKSTPFMLNYGQNPDTPVVLYLRKSNPLVNKFVGKWSEQLQCAKQCLQAAQDKQKSCADHKRRPAEPLKVGDQVLISIKHFKLQCGLKAKLSPRYLGPFVVTEVVGPQNLSYRVDLPPPLHRKHNVFHVSSLKKYHSNGTYQPPSLPEVAEEEVSFEVDHISETSGEGTHRRNLVHWLGGGQTCESACLLRGCDHHIADFWESQGQKPPKGAFPLSTAELADLLAGKQASRGE
jgi:hypothetical protein